MNSTPEIPANSSAGDAASQARVVRILARARRETSVRDLIALAVSTVWCGLLVIGAWLYVAAGRRGR